MSDALVLSGISRSFVQGEARLDVLRGADLTLEAGARVALLGPSGSGKSCLLHIAGLLERPDAGEVVLAGHAAGDESDAQRTRRRLHHIGFIHQLHNLLPEFTALENVMLPARLAGRGRGEAEAAARALLDDLGLAERATHLPAQLSGGEQQRVAIARALVNRPELLLADEPTGSLDAQTGAAVADVLMDMAAASKAAVLLVTHDMQLAARADRILHLSEGRLVAA